MPLTNRRYQENKPSASVPGLSKRQLEALEWAAKGKTASETAQIIGISRLTVRRHREIAVARLDAVNLAQAVGKAVARGLVHVN